MNDSVIIKSKILAKSGICHGFSTRHGGVSSLPHVASMNFGLRDGDTQDNVDKNIELFLSYADMKGFTVAYAEQIHSANVLTVTDAKSVISPDTVKCDGFVTDVPGRALLVRTADCVPILLCGKKADGSAVVGAAHAGWKGTVARICEVTVSKMVGLGAEINTICAAIGPSIHICCFEVKEDYRDAVRSAAGKDFADRYIICRDGRLFSDLQGMNTEILQSCGVLPENIETVNECTAHNPEKYHSHRASGGFRGVGGGMIGIKK